MLFISSYFTGNLSEPYIFVICLQDAKEHISLKPAFKCSAFWLQTFHIQPSYSTSFFTWELKPRWASQVALVVKNPPECRKHKRHGFDPWVGKIPGRRLQYSCLENPMDGGAWQAADHRIAESQTWLKQLSTQSRIASITSIPIFCVPGVALVLIRSAKNCCDTWEP